MHTTTAVATPASTPAPTISPDTLRALFPLLGDALTPLTAIEGPGLIPMPWPGPKGEHVLVQIDADGRMVRPPIMVSTPEQYMRAMEDAGYVLGNPRRSRPATS
jgi:hypothetical protein